MVPALTDTAGKNVMDLDTEIKELTEKARSGQALPQERHAAPSPSTTTASSASTVPQRSSTTLRSPSLGLGRILERPWVVDGELCVRKIMELTLSFDHRVCDGGTASGFLSFAANCMQNPKSAGMLL